MALHFKVHDLLKTREEVEKLEEMVRDKPAMTIDEILTHLLAQGYVIGRTAVGNWKRNFDSSDRFKAAADVARQLIATAANDPVAMSEAISKKAQQVIFEGLLKLETDGELSPKQLRDIASASSTVIGIQSEVIDLKAKQKAAMDEAEKVVKAGGSGEAVANKVREILGLKIQPTPVGVEAA